MRDGARSLSEAERRRYGRQLVLPEVGFEGQERLAGASVLLVGVGGLGAPVSLYLAAAGVGRLGLADFDVVDETNLQRQVIYGSRDVGRPKIAAARDRLRDLNPHVEIVTCERRVTSSDASEVMNGYDVVVDGTDNFAARYLLNDACVLLGKPYVYGSVFRFEGQVSVFALPGGPCYRCLFPGPPEPGTVPSCAEGGVLGVLPGIVGAIQAAEVVKLVLGRGDVLRGRLLLVDALAMSFRELQVPRNPDCPVCGERPTITAPADGGLCRGTGGAGPGEEPDRPPLEIEPRELKRRLDAGEEVVVLDVREPHEHAFCRLDGLLVPLGELPGRLGELDSSRDTIVYCHSGERSALAARYLRRKGFPRVWSLRGGILAWSDDVDPQMPRY